MKKICGALTCSGLLFSGAVFASQFDQPTNLETLKAKCAELASNQQIKPFNVQITCRESGFTWKPGQQVQMSHTGYREVGAAVRMKNVEIPYQGESIAIEQTLTGCPVLEKWKYSIAAVDVQLNCEELTKVTSLSQFCLPLLTERATAEPSVIQEEATGETVNLCNAAPTATTR